MPFWRKKAQVTVDRQRQVDLGYAIRQLAEGDLSLIASCSNDSSVALTLNDISILEPRRAHADSRMKEKLARRLYFYVEQPKSVPSEELVEVDRGTLTIAIKGIEFAGKLRHIRAGFGAIESISHSQNGIAIVMRNGAQRLWFEGADRVTIPLKVQDREYSQPMSGKLMRLVVEAIIRISFDGRDLT